ncbi:MAG TPA: GAF and ANTAR domain-containing protein [Microthrixaceae bacterium]|nr:GAF and ANTAR domain-containing protein [Microthrixaceae bacterium]
MNESIPTNTGGRETLATHTFVELVDSMVDEFDAIDLLTLLTQRALELLDASAAGILLADDQERLRVLAASNEEAELLELLQVQNDDGPCLTCYRTGRVVETPDLRQTSEWPRFSSEALRHGFHSVCAVPLRLRAETLGCLNLFMTQPGGLNEADLTLAQALADVSTIAMVQDRVVREAVVRERQLQTALDSRVVIEQAKGMVAQQCDVDMSAAFAVLRNHARRHNILLTDLAADVLSRSTPIDTLLA